MFYSAYIFIYKVLCTLTEAFSFSLPSLQEQFSRFLEALLWILAAFCSLLDHHISTLLQ